MSFFLLLNKVIEAMRKATGFDFKYEIIGRRPGDVPDLTADPALARKELGFNAPVQSRFTTTMFVVDSD